MSEHGERIWQRGDARSIMRQARQVYGMGKPYGLVTGHVALGSAHYSLVKRYLSGISGVLGVWHMWRAVVHARAAASIGGMNFDQVDVVSTILAKAPWWLGGNKTLAGRLITRALEYTPLAEPMDEMLPHTRALLLCTLASIEERSGNLKRARSLYSQAWGMEEAILLEESDHLMAKRQLARVLSAVGFFFYDNDGMTSEARECIENALRLANAVSQDQAEKIIAGCRERSIKVL